MKHRYLMIALLGIILVSIACASGEARLVSEGNDAFANQEFVEAVQSYENAQAEASRLAEPYYNAGNAYYRQDDYENAKEQLSEALRTAEENLAENSFYNLGNSNFQTENFEASVEAYKEALRLNPDDEDAKYNLELALRQLQSQGQQQAPQQQGQNQPQDQEQQESAEQQPNEQGEQQEGEQEQPSNGEQDTQEDQQDESSPDQSQEQQQQVALTKEQAERLLEAHTQDIQTLQEHLQRVFIASGGSPAQDW